MNLWKIPNNLATKIKLQFVIGLLALVVLATYLVASRFESNESAFHRSSPTITSHKPPSTPSQQLLIRAARNLSESLPLQAAAQLEVNLFGEHIIANGQYCQIGQGRGASRLEFSFGEPDHPQSVLQICDQGFFYRIKMNDDRPEVQTIDLRRVADVDRQKLFASPSNWMATGGLSSLLQSLAENFEFESAQASTFRSIPVLKMRGSWKPAKLKRLLFGQTRYASIQDKIQWSGIRNNIPEQCEIVLGNDDYFPLFPYRITFLRTSDVDGKPQLVEMAALQLFELQLNVDVPDEKFKINFDGMVKTQLTDSIVDRIDHLNEIQRSAGRPRNRVKK